ncbi:MAG TPA: hypothetical protein VFN35_21660 [Ktedonobacteraceae bacterium]|nr:hypothetical protein [Ktedonobacteraceae bacterium]
MINTKFYYKQIALIWPLASGLYLEAAERFSHEACDEDEAPF